MYYTEPRNLRSQRHVPVSAFPSRYANRNPNNAYLILLVVCFCGWMMASVIPQLAFTVVPVVPAPLIPEVCKSQWMIFVFFSHTEGPTPQIIRERSIPQETVPTADSFKDQKKVGSTSCPCHFSLPQKPPALIAPALDWSDLSLLSDQGNAAVAKGTAIGTLFTAARTGHQFQCTYRIWIQAQGWCPTDPLHTQEGKIKADLQKKENINSAFLSLFLRFEAHVQHFSYLSQTFLPPEEAKPQDPLWRTSLSSTGLIQLTDLLSEKNYQPILLI